MACAWWTISHTDFSCACDRSFVSNQVWPFLLEKARYLPRNILCWKLYATIDSLDVNSVLALECDVLGVVVKPSIISHIDDALLSLQFRHFRRAIQWLTTMELWFKNLWVLQEGRMLCILKVSWLWQNRGFVHEHLDWNTRFARLSKWSLFGFYQNTSP